MPHALTGVWLGLAASVAWGIYNVGVKVGRTDGFSAADLMLLRYLGGAAVMIPLMIFMRRSPFRGLD